MPIAIKPSIEIPHTRLKRLTASDLDCYCCISWTASRTGPEGAITLLPALVFSFSLRFATTRRENVSSSA